MHDKPVGLLWDSVSNNIGDQAIGLVVKRFCEMRSINFKEVNPFSFNRNDYSQIIIGGGELIRELGDPFYDLYRVPGKHILNAIGVHNPSELDYLREYQFVSVRSEEDKKQISNLVNGLDIKISPCPTILIKELFPEIKQLPGLEQKLNPVIGVHINAASFQRQPSLIMEMKKINHKYEILLFPFTLYQNDERFLTSIQKILPNAKIFPKNDPLDVLSGIGGVDLMISCSLHATIFAYVNKIPLLSFPLYPKIKYFLEDRNLDNYLIYETDNLLDKIDELLSNPPDYFEQLKADKKSVTETFDLIGQTINEFNPRNLNNSTPYKIKSKDLNVGEIFHALSMQIIEKDVEILSLNLENIENLELNQAKDRLVIENLELNQAKDRLVIENEQLKNNNINLDYKINDLNLSKSWRITRPLRKLFKRLRNNKR